VLSLLSSNFPFTTDNVVFDLEPLQERGCFFLPLPIGDEDNHVRISDITVLLTLLCALHGETWYLKFGDQVILMAMAVPIYVRLCGAGFLISIKSRWCVNPLCLTVETRAATDQCLHCRKTWPGGCQCGLIPPCRYFSEQEWKLMEEQWETLRESCFRKSAFHRESGRGQHIGGGIYLPLNPFIQSTEPQLPAPNHYLDDVMEIPFIHDWHLCHRKIIRHAGDSVIEHWCIFYCKIK